MRASSQLVHCPLILESPYLTDPPRSVSSPCANRSVPARAAEDDRVERMADRSGSRDALQGVVVESGAGGCGAGGGGRGVVVSG